MWLGGGDARGDQIDLFDSEITCHTMPRIFYVDVVHLNYVSASHKCDSMISSTNLRAC